MTIDEMKLWFQAGTTILALGGFLVGIAQYMHQNAIRRYEKFQAMSDRFDDSDEIQSVCKLLRGLPTEKPVTKQDKEVFICFLEEIHFMVRSGIMKRDLALYTFGYYAREIEQNRRRFWDDETKENEAFYMRFREFCAMANDFQVPRHMREGLLRKDFVY